MYAENYPRYRAPPGGGDAPPSSMAMGGGAGPPGGPPSSAMMAGPPQPQGGRPRGVPGGAPALRGGGGYDDAMAMAMDMAPDELAKSLQPVSNTSAGRYTARRMAAPRGPAGGRGGGGGDQWSPSAEYGSLGGYGGGYAAQPTTMAMPKTAGRQPQHMQMPPDGYAPPAKYRRTASDFDGFDDPRSAGGGRPMANGGGTPLGGGRGGPRGLAPSPNYRVPVNSYDLSTRDGMMSAPGGPGGGGGGGNAGGMYAPPSQQHQPPQLRPPPQRAGYAQYAPPSPNTPRSQQEMMMMRRRLMEQERDRFSPAGYRGGPPSSSSSSAGPTPGGAAPPPTMSSAAAAWARELDPYDNARRIHRELQPPSSNGGGGGGGGPMTPQASAQMRMHRTGMGSAPSGYENSPGSRIVTPAAALHSSQRAGEWVAPRRNPMATNARAGPQLTHGPPPPPPTQMPSLGYDEIDPMAMQMPGPGAMARGRNPRGPVNLGGERAHPPAVTAQLSMQEYEAMMMMERELTAPPAMPDQRRGSGQQRPSSAGSNGRGRGRVTGVSPMRGGPSLAEDNDGVDPYAMQQSNEYAMPIAAPMPAVAAAAPKQARQSKAAAARVAREAAAQAQVQAQASAAAAAQTAAPPSSKKRKEPAAGKRKAREAAEDMEPSNGGHGETRKSASKAKATSNASTNPDGVAEPKRRCGRKSMNYSSEQKRERNRAAVKKCRQRQALKYEYLKRKADVLASENRALSEMLVKNVELDDEKRNSLTRGIQMDILLKIKEIFTQSLPKDFVLDADSIWDLNSVLAVSMPSRCYYGIESIKDFWRTSLRMRNKGKIRSFWAWLFRLPPGDRFSEFTITPFSPTSNLYFINWTTKSTPALSGSIVIMFGHGHRVTLHVEIFGWLIWRYLLTNTPFPEPPIE